MDWADHQDFLSALEARRLNHYTTVADERKFAHLAVRVTGAITENAVNQSKLLMRMLHVINRSY